MSNRTKLLSYAISISFVLAAFLGVVHFCCFDRAFYTSEHDKLTLYGKSIPEHIGISREELIDLTDFTLDYLNDKDASLDLRMKISGKEREVFTDDEKAHMVDVRTLNLNSVYLGLVSLAVFLVCLGIYAFKRYDAGQLYLSYCKVLLYALAFFAVLGTWIIIDFDSFWNFFHHIFFSGNDLWILDLRKDILIMIVPPDFFNHLVIRIVLLFVSAIIVFGMALFFLRRKKAAHD